MKDKYGYQSAPITLDAIWETLTSSTYLRDLGGIVANDKQTIQLRAFEGIPDNTLITVDRDLFEKGLPGVPYPVHFASYGDPIFHRIMETVSNFDFPDCIVPLSETIPDLNTEVVTYAASCIDEGGQSIPKLFSRYSDLDGLILDEETILDEPTLNMLKKQFHEMVRNEFDPTRSVERLIQDNQRAADAQAAFFLIIADRVFPGFNETDNDNFW